MKKKLRMLLSLCAVTTLTVGNVAFTACGENSVEHTAHSWGEYEITTPATCTEEGVRTRHCIIEGCTETKTETIKKRGHVLGEAVDTATCLQGGVIRRYCTREGCDYYENLDEEPTEALGHDWELIRTIREAKCETGGEGEGEFTCARCNISDTHEIEKPHQVVYDTSLTVYPTCEEEGSKTGVCSVCNERVVETTPKRGHKWSFEKTEKTATCTEDGLDIYSCLNGCGQTDRRTTKAKGHELDNVNIEYPTFEKVGKKTAHCTVCDNDVEETLDMLEVGKDIEFEFRILRNNGEVLDSALKVVITDKDGTKVGDGTTENGILSLNLPAKRNEAYTMTVTGLSSNYKSSTKSVAVYSEHPVGDYYVTAKLISSSAESPSLYKVGDVLQDFSIKDIDGNDVIFSEVLKRNKLVFLNFFGVTCSYCLEEFSGFMNAYKAYKDQGIEMLIIGPDDPSYATTEANVKGIKTEYSLVCPVIYAPSDSIPYFIYQTLESKAYPTSVIVDHEGVIRTIYPGAMDETYVREILAMGASWEWKDMEATTAATVDKAAEGGLEISMLRGDYLPVFDEE